MLFNSLMEIHFLLRIVAFIMTQECGRGLICVTMQLHHKQSIKSDIGWKEEESEVIHPADAYIQQALFNVSSVAEKAIKTNAMLTMNVLCHLISGILTKMKEKRNSAALTDAQ